MSRFKKCQCHKLKREDDDFLLTTHHPKCPVFNPASELRSMEEQCKHFMGIIRELKEKIREMEKIANSID